MDGRGVGSGLLRIACSQASPAFILQPMSSDGAKAFIARWAAASASERANSQPFLCELCDILGVARPEPARETGYAFEYEVTEHHPDGSTTKGRIDLYKRGCFVLESTQYRRGLVGQPGCALLRRGEQVAETVGRRGLTAEHFTVATGRDRSVALGD